MVTRVDSATAAAPENDGEEPQSGNPAGGRDHENQLEDIVVTAQKTAESANTVGMSIAALGGDDLLERGVVDTADLAKVVPGFSFANALYGTPVYTLRGMGLNDTSIAASPAVSIYVDEVPLPFPIAAGVAPIDLERVEVLKGPQGTLFGLNSTGGAINYIAAKPTSDLAAGFRASYGRFNEITAEGFLSGPLASGINGRLSVFVDRSDDWQRNYTRSDSLGGKRKFSARGLLESKISERLRVLLSLSGWSDQSDHPAPQFVGLRPGDLRILNTPQITQQPAPRDARAADWSATRTPKKDQNFYQVALRAEYDFSDEIRLTSISSLQRFTRDDFADADGTRFESLDMSQYGKIRSWYQELRLSGESGRWNWIAGGNISRDKIDETLDLRFGDSALSRLFGPAIPWNHIITPEKHKINTAAAFVHAKYQLNDSLSLEAAARYTDVKRDFSACARDSGDGLAAAGFEFLQARSKGAANVVDIPPGGCFTLDNNNNPAFTRLELNQDNISWRAAVNWTLRPRLLLYANISRGYKAGGFPMAIATNTGSYVSVSQEFVMAYEVGVKAALFDRRMQINGAGFYYDYSDKQMLGKRIDPIVGALNAYVNVPKSEVYGAEIQVDWLPFDGAKIMGAATYLHAEVTESWLNFNVLSQQIDFKGERFPFTPKWSWDLDGEYSRQVSTGLTGFAGFHVNSVTRTTSSLGATPLFYVPARTLLDVRAGVEAEGGKWRLQVWANNLTDEYYWTDRQISQDPIFQNAGKPRTYGVTFIYRYN